MGKLQKTGCVLCAQNCGLEVSIENNRIVKVRPDKDNPRSQGYACRKGLNIAFHQHHADRLSYPLKRVGADFERISWDQAIDEIAEKLQSILDAHGPRSFAYMGGGGQGCHFEAAFGVRLLRGLGSFYHYSALAQELTGQFWAWGRATGRQYLFGIPDHHNTEVLLAVGWNGMMSHQMPQARRFLTGFSKDPDKVLVVIDPRPSETAKIADIHLPIRPGTDALLTRAMIAMIIREGLHDTDYIERHVSGFEKILPLFEGFDARAAVKVCELNYEQVREVCRLVATRKSSMHPDLGVLMNRHSTATSWLEIILMAVCGRIGVPGGNLIPGHLMPIGSHSDERDPRTWRTVATGYPAIMGVFPPNVMPEEIMNDHPDRLRAVLCSGSNPLRSYADTTAYERAFGQLELLVTCELAMTETARLSHFILPARSAYESWDGTFFAWTYPEVFFQMRRPLIEPDGEPMEASQIMVRLADRLELIPPIPSSLSEAAKKDRMQFGAALLDYIQSEPKALKSMPFVLAKTLGEEMGSANLAALWGLLQALPRRSQENAARVGFRPGPTLGEDIFQAIMDHPEGIWIGRCDTENNLDMLQTEDGRIDVWSPEVMEWIQGIDAQSETRRLETESQWPLVLMAGRHMDTNANTLMRDPEWNKGRRACTLAMNPEDAKAMGLTDGQMVRVTTEAGEVKIELEVTASTRHGLVVIPHGFGLEYNGQVYGANVNRLTKNTYRDRLAGTPLHRYVPCKVEPIEV
ncbi:MAG: molybdopterin-dependent oxidoreductase [Pseudomonadota bacterium]